MRVYSQRFLLRSVALEDQHCRAVAIGPFLVLVLWGVSGPQGDLKGSFCSGIAPPPAPVAGRRARRSITQGALLEEGGRPRLNTHRLSATELYIVVPLILFSRCSPRVIVDHGCGAAISVLSQLSSFCPHFQGYRP